MEATVNDPELKAMSAIAQALADLTDEQRRNVLVYVNTRYAGEATHARMKTAASVSTSPGEYESVGDFFDAANPQTEADRVLVVSYWLQAVEGAETFESFAANKHLKNLGHSVSNITRALDSLISHTPRFVIQTSKTGTSKQARKTYKVTREGLKRVQVMLSKGDGGENDE